MLCSRLGGAKEGGCSMSGQGGGGGGRVGGCEDSRDSSSSSGQSRDASFKVRASCGQSRGASTGLQLPSLSQTVSTGGAGARLVGLTEAAGGAEGLGGGGFLPTVLVVFISLNILISSSITASTFKFWSKTETVQAPRLVCSCLPISLLASRTELSWSITSPPLS